MVRKLGGDDDAFLAYRTAHYKLHYYETPTNLRFALLTEPGALSMRNVLHQIYINLWVEYGESGLSTSPHSVCLFLVDVVVGPRWVGEVWRIRDRIRK